MTNPLSRRRSERGLTLIEMIVSIVIISIAVIGVLGVMTYTSARSADPMVTQQAVYIARSYLEGIRLHNFSDPAQVETYTGPEAGENRASYDDIFDYNGLSEPPTDQDGTLINGLGGYTVAVTVVRDGNLGPSGTMVPNTAAAKITVEVKYGSMVDFTLVGYRTNY